MDGWKGGCVVKLCEECPYPVQDWCTECEVGLCRRCAVDHLSYNPEDHNVLPYRGRYKPYIVRSKCYIHGQIYSAYYCWNCHYHVCYDCKKQHTDHDVLSSRDSIRKFIRELWQNISILQKEMSRQHVSRTHNTRLQNKIRCIDLILNDHREVLQNTYQLQHLFFRSSVTKDEFLIVFRICNSLNVIPYYKFQLGRCLNLQEVVNLRDKRREKFTRCTGSVACVCYGPFWITLENSKGSLIYSRQYDFHGQLLDERSLPPKVSCFHSITSCGNVYFYNKANDSIELIKEGKTLVIQELNELRLNKDKRICGLYSNIFDVIFLAISYDKLKRGTVVRLDTTSGTINAIDFDRRGEPLYESPRCTDENTHGILCTVDVKGIVLFQLSTNERIPCVKVSHPRTVVTNFKEQFLVCYGPEMCPLLGIINDNGEMLRNVPFHFDEIDLICCDTKNSLLIVTNDGSVIQRISLNILQRHNDP